MIRWDNLINIYISHSKAFQQNQYPIYIQFYFFWEMGYLKEINNNASGKSFNQVTQGSDKMGHQWAIMGYEWDNLINIYISHSKGFPQIQYPIYIPFYFFWKMRYLKEINNASGKSFNQVNQGSDKIGQ